jgi:lipoprotein-anchoring transpeptidase ErfK/SrfK
MKKIDLKNKKNMLIILAIVTFLIVVECITLTSIAKTKNDDNQKIIETSETEELTEEPIQEDNSEISIEDLNNEEKDTSKKQNSKKDEKVNSTQTYYIKVNYGANVVTIYTKDSDGNYTVPVKAMICSSGRATPISGRYPIKGRWRWLGLMGGVYGQYSTQIVGNILFHSVPYLERENPGALEYWEYDKLGTKASAGCIRLTVRDAKWIYENISRGTLVEFYSDSNPGPLGKPSAQKISDNTEMRGWDPTDITEGNPWKNIKEVITKPQPNTTTNQTNSTETNINKNENENINTSTNTNANINLNNNINTNTNTNENSVTNTNLSNINVINNITNTNKNDN